MNIKLGSIGGASLVISAEPTFPRWMADQLGRRGNWVTKLDLKKYGLERTIEIIKKCAMSRSALDEFEDLAKAGLRKYVPERIDRLEKSLRIISPEAATSASDRPDFTAVDGQ